MRLATSQFELRTELCSLSNFNYVHYRLSILDPFSNCSAPLHVLLTATSSSNDVLRRGADVSLNCSHASHAASHEAVVWRRDGKVLELDHRVRRIDSRSILIRNYKFDDNGVYQCFVVRDSRSDQMTSSSSGIEELGHGDLLLMVKATPPLITSRLQEAIKVPGSDLSLKCRISGDPLPSADWFLDNQLIVANYRTRINNYSGDEGLESILNISALNVQDGGRYSCRASSSVGHVTQSTNVHVMGVARVKTLISNQSAILGADYDLNCPFVGYPIRDVHFTKGNN